MSNGTIGIEDSREMVQGIFAVSLLVAKRLSDGSQFEDAVAFYKAFTEDEALKKAVLEAWEGRQNIPGEMKDLDLVEGLTLAKDAMNFIPELLEAMKPQPNSAG